MWTLLLWTAPLVLLQACGPMPPDDTREAEAPPVSTATVEVVALPTPAGTPATFPALPTSVPTPTESPTPTPGIPSPTPAPTPTPTPVSTPLPTPTPVNVPTATPVPVRPVVLRVIFAVNAPGREYSVMRNGNQVDSMQYRPAYEHLVGIDPVSGAFIPELAATWELLEDGRSFRFRLREDVQFHEDWGAFTARDVVHSHRELAREDSTHPKVPYWRDLVTSVEAEGDFAVVFRASQPAADFLSAVSEQQSLLPIQSSVHFESEGEPQSTESPYIAGTGAYRMAERRVGNRILFERASDDHWRATPDFAEFEFLFIPEPATRLAALSTGEVHIADLPPDRQSEAQQAGLLVSRGPGPTMGLWVNLSCCWPHPVTGTYPASADSPLTNPLVRRALAKSIDRQVFNDAFFHGKAEVMHLNHWHPTRLGWNPTWESNFPEQYGYDPEAARALLAQAGFDESNPLETTVELLESAVFPDAWSVGEGVGSFFHHAGVRLNYLVRDPDSRREMRENMEDDNLMTIGASNADQYTGFALWGTPLVSPINANNHPAMTELTRRVLRTPDIEGQARLWQELGDLSYQSYLTLPMLWIHADATYDPKVVAGYSFLGSIPGTWTHVHTIKGAW